MIHVYCSLQFPYNSNYSKNCMCAKSLKATPLIMVSAAF